MAIKVAPSIFAADFYDLAGAVRLMEQSGVDMIHYDVMDNHFVPNISFGSKLIEDICVKTAIPSDVHLMINLEQDWSSFLHLPVESITLHLESTPGDTYRHLDAIHQSGKQAGLSLKPGTPVEAIAPYLDSIGLILIMSVEPGFSGQKFMPQTPERIRQMKELIGDRDIDLQVDGGVARDTYRAVLDAGADFLVIGSAFFKDKDVQGWIQDIHDYRVQPVGSAT